jgi:hypothetical protein
MSADDQSDQHCPSHGDVTLGSHCGSVTCTAEAIPSTPAIASPHGVETANARASDAAAPGRVTSPFFHPPKLVVQA